MTTDKTGGSAFPIVKPSGYVGLDPGMTLWDWYAGQALCGLLAYSQSAMISCKVVAEHADAMIAERKKRGIA